MARPRTELGTSGKVALVGQVRRDGKWVSVPDGDKPERWRARAKYRDVDGVLRDVERFGTTKGKAETKLKAAITQRQDPTGEGEFRADMLLLEAGHKWLAQVERQDSNVTDQTRAQYRAAFRRHLDNGESTLKGLTLREVNRVQVIERYLQGIADKHGSGSAKTARTVLSSVLSLAVRYGVLEVNAAREVRPAKSSKPKVSPRNTERALTRSERDHFLAVADEHTEAVIKDVTDIAYWMSGTGVRISEALRQRWDDLDLDTGRVHVRGTKTSGSDREITMPEWLRQRISERATRIPTEGLLFPTPSASGIWSITEHGGGGHADDLHYPRDRRNVARTMRKLFDEAGLEWATPHTLRRTVASDIDAAGLGVAVAADVLGHADPSMTARVYLGRKTDTSAAAKAL